MRVFRKDANHKDAKDYLLAHGVEVVDFSNVGTVPDLLCNFRGFIGWVEMKVGAKGVFYRRQLEFISETNMPVAICNDKYEAMGFLEKGTGLSKAEKNAIAVLLLRSDKNKFTAKQLQEAIKNITVLSTTR